MNKLSPVDSKEINQKLRDSYPLAHPWHNGFHLEMPFGLINDPNGLAYVKGEYHIFYQWNPLGCEHKNKCWGYVRTRDLLHYTIPQLAMQPTDIHDKNGCYSGCGFEENGEARIIYTCNRKDENNVRIPAQRFGTLQPDGMIRKDAIAVPKEQASYTGHFRDPHLFTVGAKRYFVLGAQNEAKQGRAVLYAEEDGAWLFQGELQTWLEDFGYMWECPNFLQFFEGDVLLFCPQGIAPHGYAYQNRYQCGYIAGELDFADLRFRHDAFRELDRGFDFYAPQTLRCQGRTLLWGWMGMPEEEADYPTSEHGWLFNLTVPRELHLKDGVLYQKPAAELKNLRLKDTEQIISGGADAEYHLQLARQAEVELHIELEETAAKVLDFTLNYGKEKLLLRYDREEELMTLDRTGMKLGGRGTRSFYLKAEQYLSLQILVDRASVEIFFQDGREAAAVAVYPAEDVAPELIISGGGEYFPLAAKAWELQGYTYQ